jgi:gliding motility-associated-like protein
VNPDDGLVTIYWSPSSSPSVTGYVIQEEFVKEQNFPIDTVLNTSARSHTFSYPKVLTGPVHFNIYAIDGAGNESIRTVPSHVSVYSIAEYDSCKNSIIVTWTPYVGWGDKLTGYNVFQVDENFNIKKFDDVSPGISEYTVTGIEENRNYCFYVSAIRNDGASSFSNKVCINTLAPLPPSYIAGDYTRYSGATQLELHFSVDPATVGDLYRLVRADASSGNYIQVADLTKASDGSVTYTDPLPGNRIYNYQLIYLDRCKAEGQSSIPINNILLRGRSEAMTNRLTWNSFESWNEMTREVRVYRRSGTGNLELLATLSPSETEYSDQISAENQLSGDICYQVQAISNNDFMNKVNISESNVFCVNMLGEVFIPNAFTPNNDGLNDIFKPSFAILPMKYTFVVYNRYGAKIFETNNISEGWDGRLSNGAKALEGAYIFYIRLENGAGKVLEKRGNFTVIYP